MPPKHRDNSQHACRNQHDNQSRIFDPRYCRDAKRHDQPEQADLPGKDMDTGGKGAERQQGENCQPGRAGREDSLHAGQQQQIHHHQERQPVQRLRRDQAHSRSVVACARPPVRDTDQPDDRRENFPIANNRLLGEACIGDAEYCQDQYQAERQLPDPKARALWLTRWRGLRDCGAHGSCFALTDGAAIC